MEGIHSLCEFLLAAHLHYTPSLQLLERCQLPRSPDLVLLQFKNRAAETSCDAKKAKNLIDGNRLNRPTHHSERLWNEARYFRVHGCRYTLEGSAFPSWKTNTGILHIAELMICSCTCSLYSTVQPSCCNWCIWICMLSQDGQLKKWLNTNPHNMPKSNYVSLTLRSRYGQGLTSSCSILCYATRI